MLSYMMKIQISQIPKTLDLRVSSKSENSESSDYDSQKVPAVLEEPVDQDAVIYTENKKRRKPKPIDLNVPLDQPVLLENKESPKEFDEMEDKLAEFDKAMDQFGYFKPIKNKEIPKVEYTDWEQKYSFVLDNIKDGIPILSFNSPIEFTNADRVSTLIKTFKKYNKNTTVIVGGTFYTGSGFSNTSFNGKHMIDIFNRLNVDFINFSEIDCSIEDFRERILEFKGTALTTNLKNIDFSKISKSSSFIVRKFEDPVLFLAITSEFCTQEFCTIDSIKAIESNFKDAKYVILCSTFQNNEYIIDNINDINLILSTGKNNKSYTYKDVKIANADPDFTSVYVHILKEENIISHLIPIDELIPQDPDLRITLKYWKELGYKELKVFNKIDPSLKLIDLKNETLSTEKILQYLLIILEKKFTDFRVNAICISKNLIKKDFTGLVTGYDIYKNIPEINKICIMELDHQTYTEISSNINLSNKIILNNQITEKIVIVTDENSLNNYISEYIEGEFTATLLIDIRLILVELLLEIGKK